MTISITTFERSLDGGKGWRVIRAFAVLVAPARAGVIEFPAFQGNDAEDQCGGRPLVSQSLNDPVFTAAGILSIERPGDQK